MQNLPDGHSLSDWQKMHMLTSSAQRWPVPHCPATDVHVVAASGNSPDVPVQASVPLPPFTAPAPEIASLLSSPVAAPVPSPFARSLPAPPEIVFVPEVPALIRSSPSSPFNVSLP